MSQLLHHLLLLSFVVAVIAPYFIAGAAASDGVELAKLRVKELRRMLEERGLECEGCVEKEHFLELLKDNIHLPVLSDEERAARLFMKKKKASEKEDKTESSNPKYKPDFDNIGSQDEYMERLKKILEDSNLGDKFQMFRPDDIKKMGGFDDLPKTVDHKDKFDASDEL